MLKSTTNTPDVREEIREYCPFEVADIVFEQGQWWVFDTEGNAYSVVDCCPGVFDFEEC
jgi:mRNA-degrading endonuclease HigB of HigAB toxin-antitoxin module